MVTVGKKNLWEFIHLWCFIFTLEEKLKVLVEGTPKRVYCYYFLSGMRSYLRRIKYEKPFRKLQFKMLTTDREAWVSLSYYRY